MRAQVNLPNRNLLKRMVSMGYEVEVKWLPRTPIHRHGKRLAEEVKGNTILVYAEDARAKKKCWNLSAMASQVAPKPAH